MKLSLKTCEKIQVNFNICIHNEIRFKFSVISSEILFSCRNYSSSLPDFETPVMSIQSIFIYLSVYSYIHWPICICLHPQRFWLLNSVVYNRSKMPASMILSEALLLSKRKKNLKWEMLCQCMAKLIQYYKVK